MAAFVISLAAFLYYLLALLRGGRSRDCSWRSQTLAPAVRSVSPSMTEQVESPTPGKIIAGDAGIGTVSPEMVEKRAAELAKIDGRTDFHEGDLALARDELLGLDRNLPPEVTTLETEEITGWMAPETTGTRAPKILADDDTTVAEILVQEGLEEADHDQRLTAVEENPPEEL